MQQILIRVIGNLCGNQADARLPYREELRIDSRGLTAKPAEACEPEQGTDGRDGQRS